MRILKSVNIKILIGIGNPKKKYENTYHNVGFLFIDYLNEKYKFSGYEMGKTLFKSNVFMNRSGLFVKKIIKKLGVKEKETLIVHDDSDIELGKYKLSIGKGGAGHKGAESIINSLGTKNFWRIRIGTSQNKPYQKNKLKAEEFVLRPIKKEDGGVLEKVFEKVYLQLKTTKLIHFYKNSN